MPRRVHTEKTNNRVGIDALRAIRKPFASRLGGTKSRAALALAVSLWMAGSGVASAAGILYLDASNNDEIWHSNVNLPSTPTKDGKTLTVTGGTWTDWSIYGGSYSSLAYPMKDYTLNLNGIQSEKASDQAQGARTAYGNGASDNCLNMTDSNFKGSVYGAYVDTSNGNVTNNHVTIKGSTVGSDTSMVVGGYASSGNAGGTGTNEGNSVTVENSTINATIYGGQSNTNAIGNSVKISGTTNAPTIINKSVCGGYVGYNSGSATGNSVTIDGATVNGSVVGGEVNGTNSSAVATGNSVTIRNATVSGNVFGGYGGVTTGNTITLHNATLSLDNSKYDIYGGYNGNTNPQQTQVADNTLELSGEKNVAGNVCKFETIKFLDTTAWNPKTEWTDDWINTMIPVLDASKIYGYKTSGSDQTNIKLDVSAVAKAWTKPGTMVLINVSNPDHIYVNGDTDKDLKGKGSSNIITVHEGAKTESDDGSGVTFDYVNTHIVRLDSPRINYIIRNTVNTVTLGTVAWNPNAPARTVKWTEFDLANAPTLDASKLTFTCDASALPTANDAMTLLYSEKELLYITGKQRFEKDASAVLNCDDATGVRFTASAAGKIKQDFEGTPYEYANNNYKGRLDYTINSVALSGIDLAKWNGTGVAAVPDPAKWPAAEGGVTVLTDDMAKVPTLDAGASRDIVTASAAIFSDDKITGANVYKPYDFTPSEAQGVTLSGTQSKGVRAAADGKKVVYAVGKMDVARIALGTMTWGTPRDVGGTDYDFANPKTVDATNLEFTNPEAATGSTTLLSGAAKLAAGASIAHTQDFDKTAANGATLSATLSGSVTRRVEEIGYTATGTTLTGVDLTDWDGVASSEVPTGWTAKSGGVAVTADSTFAPGIDPGTSQDILTAATDHYFDNAQIADAIKYKAGASSADTENGVTLTGAESKGVRASADGRSLVYARSPFDVGSVALGGMTWGTDRDGSGATYNYAGVSALDTSGLALTIADPESVKAGDSTTFLKANSTLKNMAAQAAKDVAYSVSPAAGASVSAAVRGSVSARGGSVVYTVTENKASKLTFTNVNWLTDGALIDHSKTLTNVSFDGADVDTAKISFTNLQTLDTDSKMTLVSGFGTSAGAINGSVFTVGKGTGEGHAYLESSDLRYLVTRGVSGDTPTPTPEEDISDRTRTVEPGETVTGDVVAAEATGSETATSNTAEVVKGGVVGTKEEPLNVVGATTVSGAAKENAANITGGTVNGDVAGATTVSGDAAGNTAAVTDGGVIVGSDPEEKPALVGAVTKSGTAEGNVANVTGGTVNGDVLGALSATGIVRQNEANITGGTVNGYVTGAATGDALADGNAANITGGTVNGSVMGSDSLGDASGNTASVKERSTVNGDVLGAYTSEGDAVANHAVVSGSTVREGDHFGDVLGAETEKGVAYGNTATVTDSVIAGDVLGGLSDQGEANNNEAHVTGGAVGSVYGGYSYDGGVDGNTATVDGGATVQGEVYGGGTELGDAGGNKAVVSGSTVVVDEAGKRNGDVIGGFTLEGVASGNTATVTDSHIAGSVYGGYAEKGSAAGNTVEISGDATVVDGSVYGGKSTEKSEGNRVTMTGGTVNKIVGGGCETATGNVVLLGGGKVTTAVYGGEATKTATNNSVTLYGTADVSGADVFGGSLEATGNVLYVGLKDTDVVKSSAWTGGAVKNLANFETIRFDVVKWDTETAALTIADGTASDLSQTTVDAAKVQFTDAESLKANDTMTLLEDSAVEASKRAQEANLTKDSSFTVGTTAQGTGTVSLDGDGNVIYTVKDVTSGEKAHSAVMGLEAGMAALSVGNDFIGDATAGLGLPANEGADGVSTYARMGGGKLRQTTGSHVDVNTWNAIIAIGKQNKKERSTTEFGVFFEYGSGNYTTHNGAERGDGSARYTGGGLLAKWKQAGGLYVEGSLRAGTVKDDAKNVLRDGLGVPYSYDTNAGYFGAHIGVGREIGLKGGNTVDVYAKYFHNRRNGVSFDAGGHYDLDAITSSVLRVGARYTMKREAWNFYGGLAYEYEMDGEAKGVAGGLAIRGADIGGGSARLELGATMTPAKSPWTLDLNLTGFAGKKRGLMGGVSVGFMF